MGKIFHPKLPMCIIRERLEEALNRRPLPGVSLRVALLPTDHLELRVEADACKWIMPVFWNDRPPFIEWIRHLGHEAQSFFFACPKLSDGMAAAYMKEPALCHADLNGRLFLRRDGLWLLREPSGDQIQNAPQTASPYSGKASRIPRTLLARPEHRWTQLELQEVTQASPGYVSRVLRQLVDAGQVKQDGRGGPGGTMEYQVQNGAGILNDWEKEDRFWRRVSLVEYSVVGSDPERLASQVRDALPDGSFAFTQWIAAWFRHPHTTPPVVSAYVRSRFLQHCQIGRRVSSGGNLWLLVPKDEGVFQETQTCEGFRLVSDAQIYLDLTGMGRRGPDAAQALRAWEGFGGAG